MFLSPWEHVLELVVIEVIVESEALVSADDLGTVSWEKCILESTLNNSFHLRAASWGCFKNLKILEWITALGPQIVLSIDFVSARNLSHQRSASCHWGHRRKSRQLNYRAPAHANSFKFAFMTSAIKFVIIIRQAGLMTSVDYIATKPPTVEKT